MWVHSPHSPSKVLSPYPEITAKLILKALKISTTTFGRHPDVIITPYTADQLNCLVNSFSDWAILMVITEATFDNHYPPNPLLQFWKEHPVIFPRITRRTPIVNAITVFTDGSDNGTGAMTIDHKTETFLFPSASAQHTELLVVIEVFKNMMRRPLTYCQTANMLLMLCKT